LHEVYLAYQLRILLNRLLLVIKWLVINGTYFSNYGSYIHNTSTAYSVDIIIVLSAYSCGSYT